LGKNDGVGSPKLKIDSPNTDREKGKGKSEPPAKQSRGAPNRKRGKLLQGKKDNGSDGSRHLGGPTKVGRGKTQWTKAELVQPRNSVGSNLRIRVANDSSKNDKT